MIVCHCTGIADSDIRAAVDWMRAADPETLITPGKVYRALGRAPDCGGCMPLFLESMEKCDTLEIPINLRGLRRTGREGQTDERRHEGYRLP